MEKDGKILPRSALTYIVCNCLGRTRNSFLEALGRNLLSENAANRIHKPVDGAAHNMTGQAISRTSRCGHYDKNQTVVGRDTTYSMYPIVTLGL